MKIPTQRFTLIFSLLMMLISSDLWSASTRRAAHSPFAGLNQTPRDQDAAALVPARQNPGALVIPNWGHLVLERLEDAGPVAVRMPNNEFLAQQNALVANRTQRAERIIEQAEQALAARNNALQQHAQQFAQSLTITHDNLQRIIDAYTNFRTNIQRQHQALFRQAQAYMLAHQEDQLRIRALQTTQDQLIGLFDRYEQALVAVKQATSPEEIARTCAEANGLRQQLEDGSNQLAGLMEGEAQTAQLPPAAPY